LLQLAHWALDDQAACTSASGMAASFLQWVKKMAEHANAIVSCRFMMIKFYGLKKAERKTLNAKRRFLL
jgi:hypothetical protein